MNRAKQNPLITVKDIKPTKPYLKVDGVFNCGATKLNNQYILLLRVAESAVSDQDNIHIPIINNHGIEIKTIQKDDIRYDFGDSRTIKLKNGKVKYLTSLSHFRRAFSTDGIHFNIDETPWIFPESELETFGIEDPRITHIEDKYLITYTQASPYGVSVGLIETTDFVSYERKGTILPVDNKDVSIFPEKINNLYYMYHRPVPGDMGYPNMWVATSNDLYHWGNHKLLLSVSENGWDNGRVGGGAPAFKTDKGWVHIYHAATLEDSTYGLGAFLTSIDDPSQIIHRSLTPILYPEADYETTGFFKNVVFTCGLIVENQNLLIYYGAADDKICLATITLDELYEKLVKVG
jgi:predicted GH43/DUF377 family glycosyl hydrolase